MQLRYGTVVEVADGRVIRLTDRVGHVHAELRWAAGTLDQLIVTGALVRGAVIDHPLLGEAHAIAPVDTAISALDWARPTRIPTIAEPGRLPPGSGGAIMNVLAHLARRSDVGVLRYAGPYPTPALFRSLLRSFHTRATEAEFTADVYGRAMRLTRDEIAIDFVPDPCERVAIPDGWIELRRGLERVVHHGVTYEGDTGVARIVESDLDPPPGERPRAAEIWFGDSRYCRIATFDLDGHVLAGPFPIPTCQSPVLGRAFPDALRDAIADLVAEAVPPPLAADARDLIVARPITWADLGARSARARAGGIELHAALWDRVAPHGLARVALAIAEALAPVVTNAIVGAIAHRSSTSSKFAP